MATIKKRGRGIALKPADPNVLDARQAEFIRLWLETNGDIVTAYRKAYRRPHARADNARDGAKKVMGIPSVKLAIAEAKLAATESANAALDIAGARYAISKSNILERLSHLAFSDMRAFLTWGPDGVEVKHSDDLTDAQAFAVVEVQERVTRAGRSIRIKLADKRQAITDLAKVAGILAEAIPDKPTDAPDLVQARRETRQRFLDLLEKLAKPEPLTIEGNQALDIVTGKNTLEKVTRK